MASRERVNPGCVNANNPYHECGVACQNKGAAQGHRRKEQKKTSDYGNGIKADHLGKKRDGIGERRSNPNCPKAANPYHQCNENCPNGTPNATPRGNERGSGSILAAPQSFGKKNNGPESRPQSREVVANGSLAKTVYRDNPSPRTPQSARKPAESDNSHSSSHLHSDDIYSQEHSFVKGRVRPSEIVPVSGFIMPDDGPNSPPNGSLARYAFGTLATPRANGKISCSPVHASSPVVSPKNAEAISNVPASPKANPSPAAKNGEELSLPVFKSMKFSISGISQATEDSDLEESISVVTDAFVGVGNYQVRPYLASTLQAVLDKHGDIAANSSLESSSLRSYHLECLCSVVQELQSTPFNRLTRSKLKEMLAVLRDVESANIDVGWLRSILSEHTDVIDHGSRYQTAEAAKEECDNAIASMKKDLELLGEELAEREKAAAETNARMEDTRARLQELQLEASRLNDTISTSKTKLEKYHSKPLAEGIL